MKQKLLLIAIFLLFSYKLFSQYDTPLNNIALENYLPANITYPFSFVVLGDSRGEYISPDVDNDFKILMNQIASLSPKPKFVINIGDFVENGDETEYQVYYDYILPWMQSSSIAYFSVPGNHEFWTVGSYNTFYPQYIGDKDFSFDIGNVRIIGINNVQHEDPPNQNYFISDEQLINIENLLSASSPPLKFGFTHVPLLEGSMQPGYYNYLNLLEANNAKANFCGHYHFYKRNFRCSGFSDIITGGGGVSTYGITNPPVQHPIQHFLLITITEDNNVTVNTHFINVGNNDEAQQYDFIMPTLDGEILQNKIIQTGEEIVWNAPASLISNIIVKGTLTISSEIKMFANTKITIERGGKLILDGGKLTTNTNCDIKSWQGIEVQGNSSLDQLTESNQGILELKNGASIENAKVGVLLGSMGRDNDYDSRFGGGIIKVDAGCSFKNNTTAIIFTTYTKTNTSYINGSAFTTDNNFLATNPITFIRLINVTGINIKGNSFINSDYSAYSYDKRGQGILSTGSKFTVDDYSTNQSKFENLWYGINANTYTAAFTFSIINSDFKNNYIGVKLNAVNYANITYNNFEVNSQLATNDNSCGVYISSSSGYGVQKNNFTTNTNQGHYGIYIDATGTAFNKIYQNKFTGLITNIQTAATNYRLYISCNDFNSTTTADIAISSGSIAFKQGTCLTTTSAANNSFSHYGTSKDILINENEDISWFYYSYNPSSRTTPDVNSIYVEKFECSTPYNAPTMCPAPTQRQRTQLITDINTTTTTLNQLRNKIDGGNTQSLLTIALSNQAPGQIKNKLLAVGPYLSDEVLLAVIQRPGKTPLPNGIVKEIVIPNSPVTKTVMNAINILNPAMPAGILTEINNVQTGTSPRVELENQIASVTEQNGSAINELLQIYLLDSTIVNGTDSLIAFLQTQTDPAYIQQLIQAYIYTEQCTQAKSLLTQMQAVTADDINFKTFFTILADLCISGDSIQNLTAQQLQTISDIANSETQVAANAQSLLSYLNGTYYPEKFEPLIAPDSLNLHGKLISSCNNINIANQKIYFVKQDSSAVSNPVTTDSNGNFSISYFDMLTIGDSMPVGFATVGNIPVENFELKTIPQWLTSSPVTIYLSKPEISISVSDSIICNGDTMILSAITTGGILPYFYNWSTGDTTSNIYPLTSNFYSLTVTDSIGCSDTASYNAIIAEPLLLTIQKQDINCSTGNTGSATATPSGGTPPYTYLWSNGASSSNLYLLTSNLYSLTVTDSHTCTTTASVTINQINDPGTVLNQWKISKTSGNFNAPLTDGNMFGTGSACIGDLDGDGIKDLITGASFTASNTGAAYLMFMNADRTVKSYRKLSSPEIPVSSSSLFGQRVDTIGDIDNDGITEIAIGAEWDADGGTYHGATWLISLNTNGTVKWYQKISDTQGNFTAAFAEQSSFGSAATSIGDFDNDGVNDIAVGARRMDGDKGAIYLLYMNTNGTVKSYTIIGDNLAGFNAGLNPMDQFGNSLANLGDLDGDGIIDLAVGAYQDSDDGSKKGAVWILFLNANGTVKSYKRISDYNFAGTIDPTDYFGMSVEYVNKIDDINGDGVVDLIVGAVFDDDGGTNTGALYVIFLNSDATVNGYQKISKNIGCMYGLNTNDMFGYSVTVMGDFASDSTFNIAAGAAGTDDGGTDIGALWIMQLEKANSNLALKSTTCSDLSEGIKSPNGITENIYESEGQEKAVLAIEKEKIQFYVFPNPYKENTTINYELKAESTIDLEVYTMSGQKIHTIYSGTQTTGTYRYDFSAKRLGYASGTYLLKIIINNDINSYWLVEMK